jgi:pyruvate/2-oxoglutarate dehydrogenase complex dihydrolipoamide dehydrogenase (E3) component
VSAVERFDMVVIGSGPAGEKAAAQAAYFGKRVAVVERAPSPGGAVVLSAEIPSTRAYLRDFPEAELHMLDSGHFAVEDSLDEIATHSSSPMSTLAELAAGSRGLHSGASKM